MSKENLIITQEHYNYREFKLNLDVLPFNTLVHCATMCFNKSWKQWEYTGRLVQVRKKAKYGMDLFFIRRCDGSLYSFYNEGVFPLNENGIEYCDIFFKDVPIDEPNKEYSINNKLKKVGFIVPESNKPMKRGNQN